MRMLGGREERRLPAPLDASAPAGAQPIQEPPWKTRPSSIASPRSSTRNTACARRRRARGQRRAPQERRRAARPVLGPAAPAPRQARVRRRSRDRQAARHRHGGELHELTLPHVSDVKRASRFGNARCCIRGRPPNVFEGRLHRRTAGQPNQGASRAKEPEPARRPEGSNASQGRNDQQSQSGATRASKAARKQADAQRRLEPAEPVGRRPRPARQQHQVRPGPGAEPRRNRRSRAATAAIARTSSADAAGRPAALDSSHDGRPARPFLMARRGQGAGRRVDFCSGSLPQPRGVGQHLVADGSQFLQRAVLVRARRPRGPRSATGRAGCRSA